MKKMNNIDPSRFYFRFRWWHILLILLVLILGFLAWAGTWDYTPKVKPKLSPQPALELTNDAWIGYWVEPFKVNLKSDNAIVLILTSDKKHFVKARTTTEIPLAISHGDPQQFTKLLSGKIRIETAVTASRWGLSKTVVFDREGSIMGLLDKAWNNLTDALP